MYVLLVVYISYLYYFYLLANRQHYELVQWYAYQQAQLLYDNQSFAPPLLSLPLLLCYEVYIRFREGDSGNRTIGLRVLRVENHLRARLAVVVACPPGNTMDF